MTIILEVLIVLIAIWLVVAPLLRNQTDVAMEFDFDADSLERQKESVFTTLGEIEFDYRMHKLEKDDYEALRRKYRSQAVKILKEEEKEDLRDVEVTADDADLEGEIAKEIEKEIEREIEKEVEALKGNGNRG